MVCTYDTKGQTLDRGLCYKERVVGFPRKRRGRKGSSGGAMGQFVIIIQTRTMIVKMRKAAQVELQVEGMTGVVKVQYFRETDKGIDIW